MAAQGQKLHNAASRGQYYVTNNWEPQCAYFGFIESGFWNCRVSGVNPQNKTVTISARAGGEGEEWGVKYTCKMENVNGKWLVSSVR